MQVRITGLRLDAVIGCYDFERSIRQPLSVDLEIVTGERPSLSDELGDTLDYDSLSREIKQRMEATSFRLIEALAGAMADLVLTNSLCQEVTVTVHKPTAVAICDDVSITLNRKRAFPS